MWVLRYLPRYFPSASITAGGVVVDARLILFVDRDDDHHLVLLRQLAHQRDGGTVGHALGQVVPARLLLGAEVGAVEDLLQAEQLDLLLRRLAISLTCLSTIAFLIFGRPASGPSTFLAWIRPPRTMRGIGSSFAPLREGRIVARLDRRPSG
jgi:hypothetical protein